MVCIRSLCGNPIPEFVLFFNKSIQESQYISSEHSYSLLEDVGSKCISSASRNSRIKSIILPIAIGMKHEARPS